jgi:prephenate dehydratase
MTVTKISFQGEYGAYSDAAARKYIDEYNETITHVDGYETFDKVLQVTSQGAHEHKYSILPVENSIEGTVGQSIDAITNTDLHAINELYLKIEHCLISTGRLEDIDTVYSHPQALGQCSKFIKENNLKTVPTYDTAGSVKIISELKKDNYAAIASSHASDLYHVPTIKEGIADNSNNFTRFLVFSKENTTESGNDKTSVIFSVKHESGALYQILKEFQDNGINLTKIESRPNKNTNWEYNFFVDFLGHYSNSKIKSVLDRISENTLFLKVIGSYPVADLG